MKRFVWASALLVGLVAFAGCDSDPSKVKTEYVEGVVTLNGEPLPMAQLTFNPVSSEGKAAFGASDKDGKYMLTTDGGKIDGGAVTGEYVVTVEKRDVPPIADVSTDPDKPSPPIAVKIAPLVTPAKYKDVTTSDLKVKVEKGDNTINLELAGKK